MFKQKDEQKSETWREELRCSLARLLMTLHQTDEAVAGLDLPWYAGRRDEFGRLEVVGAERPQRWRGRANFSDPSYWNMYWDHFFTTHGWATVL